MNMLIDGVHAQGKQKQLPAGSWKNSDLVKPIKEEMMTYIRAVKRLNFDSAHKIEQY